MKNNHYKIWLKKLLPLLDKFRTLNWTAIKRDIEFSKIFELFPVVALQNSN